MSDTYDCLFLYNEKMNFIMNALKDIVSETGIQVTQADISMDSLNFIKDFPSLILVEAEILLKNAESRVYLCDRCIEKGNKLVLIGDQDDLKKLLDCIVGKVIAKTFQRPINNKEAAKELQTILKELEAKGARKNVLVVDDSPVFLRTVSDWLEADYNVNICPSATAAFHMMEVNKPDLILLDYEMPVCSGAQFLEMLHSELSTSEIPVIFLTSRGDADTVKKVLALGPQGYLLKSQPKENILQSIADFFEKEKASIR